MKIINEISSMIASLNSIKARIDADPSVADEVSDILNSNDSFAEFFLTELSVDPETDTPALQAASELSIEHYLTDSLAESRAHKPTVKELMDATGLEFHDAGSMIGVGAAGHADYRDWQKIMSSSDPAAALSTANGQLFSGAVEWDPYGSNANVLDPARVVAKSGSYALYRSSNSSGGDGYVTLQMLDGNDRRLTQAGVTGDQIARRAKIYGADLSDLASLVDQVDDGNARLQAAMRLAVSGNTKMSA